MSVRAESKFYARVKTGLAPRGFLFYRVENKLELSLPDAFFSAPGALGWAEFKVAKELRRGWAIDWSGRKKQLMTLRSLKKAQVPVVIIVECGDAIAVTNDVDHQAKLGSPITAPFFNNGRWPEIGDYIRNLTRR